MTSPELPRIASDPWRICTQPDLGDLSNVLPQRADIVDHSFYLAPDGQWRLWACMRGTAAGRLIYGWRGASLESTDWEPDGIKLRAKAEHGEKAAPGQEQVGAPYFLRADDRLYCFYHSEAGVFWLESCDGLEFQRKLNAQGTAFNHEGGRDVMVLQIDGLWYAYSTVTSASASGWRRSFVILRTSRDLREWSDYTIVADGGLAGNGPVSAESPFIVQRGDWFYMFRSSSISFNTYVYRSATPWHFGVNDDAKLIAVLPIKAPEIVEHEGVEYISDLADFDGIRLARLEWIEDTEPEGTRQYTLHRAHRKNELIRKPA